MKRIPALAGLRAVAIAMVIGYHVDKGLIPAGYWGVIVFFVLSGYLITRLLSDEVDQEGRIDYRAFFLRRGLRLLPALVVFSLVLLAAGVAWAQVAPALGHYANYARIAGLDLGLLTHTWFLAVVAHFYLVWPFVIAAIPKRHRLRAVGLIAVAFIAWRAIAIGVMSPGWVYNATDANAAALLVGSWLGVARPGAWRWAGWSIPALLGLMLIPAFGEQGSAFLWGGFVPIALGVLAVQYALSRPSWLERPVMVWVGTISYGLYLWHYAFVRSDIPLRYALPLSVAVAAASWYLVEQPAKRLSSRLQKLLERPRRTAGEPETVEHRIPDELAHLRRADSELPAATAPSARL